MRRTVCRMPASAGSGTGGSPSARSFGTGEPESCSQTLAIWAHIVGSRVSGGQARSG